MTTPWGDIERATEWAEGIVFVSTPSHGGFVLTEARAKAMPRSIEPFTGNRRYWEEDCDAALVMLRFCDDMGIPMHRLEKERAFVTQQHGAHALAAIDQARKGTDR